MTRIYKVEKQVRQLQKGDTVEGLVSQLSGEVVGVEQYRGEFKEHEGTTTVVIRSDGPVYQSGVFPDETICLVKCLA